MGRNTIDAMLFDFEDRAEKRFGYSAGQQIIYPLMWWVRTDRISSDYLRALCGTNSRQRTTIIKRLAAGGAVDDCVDRVKLYLDKIQAI